MIKIGVHLRKLSQNKNYGSDFFGHQVYVKHKVLAQNYTYYAQRRLHCAFPLRCARQSVCNVSK